MTRLKAVVSRCAPLQNARPQEPLAAKLKSEIESNDRN